MWEERSLVHSCCRGRRHREDLGGGVRLWSTLPADVETLVRPWAAALALIDHFLHAPLLVLTLWSVPHGENPLNHINSCVLTLAWRYWLTAFRSVSPRVLCSTGSFYKSWNNHMENWQRRTCAVASVIITLTSSIVIMSIPNILEWSLIRIFSVVQMFCFPTWIQSLE